MAPPAASEETSGPGPAASVEAPSTRTAMSSSSSISLRISSPLLALADDFLAGDVLVAGDVELAPEQAEQRLRLGGLFLELHLAHVDPVLEFLRLDHVEHDERCPPSAARGSPHRRARSRPPALVDDDQELAAVTGLEERRFFMRAHGRMLPR